VDFVWTSDCLIGFRCLFWKGEGSAPCQSMCFVRALSQTDQLSSLRSPFILPEPAKKA